MKPPRVAIRVGAAILGAALGGGVVLALGNTSDRTSAPADDPAPARVASESKAEPAPVPEFERSRPSRRLLLAWSPGGLPASGERRAESLAGVKRATTVLAQLEWIESSRASDGRLVDVPDKGFAIPFEVAAVEPREYAHFIPGGDTSLLRSLRPGRLLLAETAATLRGEGLGLEIVTDSARRRVSGVVSDVTTNGYEGLIAAPAPASWSDAYRFLLVELERPRAWSRVATEIKGLVPDQRVQIRTGRENPFMRYGDAVLPQMLVKEAFGEFAARPLPDGFIDIDSDWRHRHIIERSLPIVGEVTCHRDLFRQLSAALAQIRNDGLGHLIHPEQFEGCFSPRFISRNPAGNLSHHSWGMAIDLNADENPFGHEPKMDDRIVSVFEKWGFTWGGDWIFPDGMHFEWIAPP